MKISEMMLKKINRDYLLPSIQREFVWLKNPKEKKIEKLFDSIMQEYPFGSILIWEIDKPIEMNTINWEVYDFVQDYNKNEPHNSIATINGYKKLFLVLDGQQRLSALNLGLRGSFKYTSYKKERTTKLYLNLFSEIESNPDNDYGFKYEFCFKDNIIENPKELWFEVGKVLDYHNNNTEIFKESFDELIREKTNDSNKIIQAKMILGQLHNRICGSDNLLQITPITGDDEKALNVFVRTNDGGVKLEKADLLLSYMEANKQIFQPNGARREISDFVDLLNKEEVHKPNYGLAKDDILKATLVLSNLEVQYKLKNFNKENLECISNNWNIVKKYTELTMKLIARFGFSSKNIVSKNALIPISYYLMKTKTSTEFIASQDNTDITIKTEIIKWLVVSQLTGAFGSSSDSTLKSVRNSINEGKSFKEINLGRIIEKEDVEKWINKESYNSRYSHLILLLVTNLNYWDECHQDHIFPHSKFKKEEYHRMKLDDSQIDFYSKNKNSIVNLHLLNPAVNIVKSNDDFIDWHNSQNTEFLKSSLIPTNIDLNFSNFKHFFIERKKLLIEKVFDLVRP
jgi:uncharacterized protein with ParB-like and HNH nuclease domain